MDMGSAIFKEFEDANNEEMQREWNIIVYDIPDYFANADETIDIEFENANEDLV